MELDLSPYKGLIFDMDGTLIDSMPVHLKAWQLTSEKFGFPFERDWFHSLGGMPSNKTALEVNRRYNTNFDPQLLVEAKSAFFEAIDNKGSVIESTFAVLKANRADKKIAIGTGCQRKHAIPMLTEADLLPLLDTVVTANEVENHKPNPDTFLKAAEQLGLAPHECVVFEDTELGRQAAEAAGMHCYLVVDGEIRKAW